MSALVEAQNLVKHFPVARKLGQVMRGERPAVKAVDGVTFSIAPARLGLPFATNLAPRGEVGN